jgi:hypothetical protein
MHWLKRLYRPCHRDFDEKGRPECCLKASASPTMGVKKARRPQEFSSETFISGGAYGENLGAMAAHLIQATSYRV